MDEKISTLGCHFVWTGEGFSDCFRNNYLYLGIPIVIVTSSLMQILIQYGWPNIRRWSKSHLQDRFSNFEELNGEESKFSDISFNAYFLYQERQESSKIKLKHNAWFIYWNFALFASYILLNMLTIINTLNQNIRFRTHSIVFCVLSSFMLTLHLLRIVAIRARRKIQKYFFKHLVYVNTTFWCLVTALLIEKSISNVQLDDMFQLIPLIFLALSVSELILIGTTVAVERFPIEFQEKLPSSPQPYSSLLANMTYTWIHPLLKLGSKQKLNLKDVYDLEEKYISNNLTNDFKTFRKSKSFRWSLIRYLKYDFLEQFVWSIIGTSAHFISPIAMKGILKYIEDRTLYTRPILWFFAACIFFGDLISTLFDGIALERGRRISVKLQAIIISELYSKALRRRICHKFSKAKEENNSNSLADDNDDKNIIDLSNSGTIFNLMAVDTSDIKETGAYMHQILIKIPLEIFIASCMLYYLLGKIAFIGISSTLILIPINHWISSNFVKIQKQLMKLTDKRISKMNEILASIRIIKYFAWEYRFKNDITEIRQAELKQLRRRYIFWAFTSILWSSATPFTGLVTLTSYVFFSGQKLTASLAFTVLAYIEILRFPLDALKNMITSILSSQVALDRIQCFFNEEDTGRYDLLIMKDKEFKFKFSSATLSWSCQKDLSEPRTSNQYFQLRDIDLEIPMDQFTVITGPTGSGKSSLLMALLGEMTLLKGTLQIPGSICCQNEKINPVTGLIDSVAYCAQTAWIFNDTIRRNIVFSSKYDQDRYFKVLAACALIRDLEILGGDLITVGENGITLSGGQKQRISLARALYSRARILILDDCLSALDAGTTDWVLHKVLLGELAQNRTIILVTLAKDLVVTHADFLVYLDNGEMKFKGSPQDLLNSRNKLLVDEDLRILIEKKIGNKNNSRNDINILSQIESIGDIKSILKLGDSDMDKEEEMRHYGSPGKKVYMTYFTEFGNAIFFVILGMFFFSYQGLIVLENVLVRSWTISLDKLPESLISATKLIHTEHVPGLNLIKTSNSTIRVSILYAIFILLVVFARGISLFFTDLLCFRGSLKASKTLHERLISKVMSTSMRFFETTPHGQIINRFSKDLEIIDREAAATFSAVFYDFLNLLSTIIIVIYVTPSITLAIPLILICSLWIYMTKYYLDSSREIKRIESITRSPLYQQFEETINGISTIRAYGEEMRFLTDNLKLIDIHNRPYYFNWMTNRWLSFRSDVLAALLSFTTAVLVIKNIDKIDSGLAGISLSFAIQLSTTLLWFIRFMALNELNMNSVERFLEYSDLKGQTEYEEDTLPMDDSHILDESWPQKGEIEIKNLVVRYSEELPIVLNGISLYIEPGTKVGIVGRTGAGKSTIASALFRIIEPVSGHIKIDQVDINTISLQKLRSSLTIIPQDPILFQESIRYNLDPFKTATDEELYSALQVVKLISKEEYENKREILNKNLVNSNIFLNLDSKLSEGANNLSVGQKQLICLARSLLKKSKVIVMDESTASVDHELQNQILYTLLHEYRDSTVLTIAHRLLTVIEYDYILVLSHGEILEYDTPKALLSDEASTFSKMCKDSGFYEQFCRKVFQK